MKKSKNLNGSKIIMESVLPICRVCLNASNETIDLQTRFKYRGEQQTEIITAEANEINYLECLRRCTNLPIQEYDDGPQYLCTGCEAELQVVYKFLQKAQSSQAILEDNWLKAQQTPNKETIDHAEIVIETIEEEETVEEEIVEEQDNEYEHLVKTEEPTIDYYEEDKQQDESFEMSEDNIYIEAEEVISDFELYDSQENQLLTEDSNTSQENTTKTFIAKNHKCHICDRVYTTPNLLKVHLNYHKRKGEENKAYQCKMCGEHFSSQRYLNQHLAEEIDCQVTHKCEFCDKEYITKIALNSHKRMHQGQLFTCDECGKQFKGSYELKVHQRFHKREKEVQVIHKCEICAKEYTSARYLNQHMVVHLGDRETYKCKYCDKVYISKTALNNHTRLHEGQTLDCSVCGKRFTRNCELKIHMRFHNREHPYECTLCDKKFAIKGHLKTHMLQHQGVKWECGECGKLFGSSKALNEHSYTHSEMPYPCDFCSKAFPTKQKYKMHLEKVHSTDNEGIELIKIESLADDQNSKKHKNFTYYEVIEEPEGNEQ